MREGFSLTRAPNPHLERGRRIVQAHPEVKRYFRTYPPTALWIVAVVALQLAAALLVRQAGWLWLIVAAYLVGAFASHALFVLIHDAGHNLIFRRSTPNRLFGILCNVGQGFPTAMSFRAFHALHHSHLDEYDFDGDLPFHREARLVGVSPWRKALWLLLFPFIELIRPLRIRRSFVDRWILANTLVIAATDAAIAYLWGPKALAYIVLSTVFGVGFHVVGARWVQEHFTFREGQETYSYYGPLNWVAFNIGYHNEHHDLVRVPWVYLPKVRALAPEFYDGLYAHRSWTRVLLRFLFDEGIDLYTRIARERPFERPASAA